MLFVLVGFFQALGLTLITEPLNQFLSKISEYAPRVLGVGLLLLVAWIVARAVKLVLTAALQASRLDERLGERAGLNQARRPPMAVTMANAVYWLILLLSLPAVLKALAIERLLGPVQGMIDKVLGFLPNLFAGLLILAIDWFVARLLQQVVVGFLAIVGGRQPGAAPGPIACPGRGWPPGSWSPGSGPSRGQTA